MIKRVLLVSAAIIATSSAAQAADWQPPPASQFDWTGFYMGINAGAAWNASTFDNDFAGPILGPLAATLGRKIEGDQTVFTIGGQMGYNWQIDSFVLGIETDFNYLDFNNSRRRGLGGADFARFSTEADWYGTTVGVLGIAADNLLFYGTGGVAYGHSKANGRVVIGVDTWRGSHSNTNLGWTAGAGMKYAADNNWILGAEYKYVDLGKTDFGYSSTTIADSIGGNTRVKFNVVRATLDFKF